MLANVYRCRILCFAYFFHFYSRKRYDCPSITINVNTSPQRPKRHCLLGRRNFYPLNCKQEEQSSPLIIVISNLTLVSKEGYHVESSLVPIYHNRTHLRSILQLFYSTLWDEQVLVPRLSPYKIYLKEKRADYRIQKRFSEKTCTAPKSIILLSFNWHPFAVVLITRTTRAYGILVSCVVFILCRDNTLNGIYECSVTRNVEQIFAMICDRT
uniref:Uncharacterized protein n=1 Tax=Glossina palpalis gambiensis TaxID=67801 RepID=A0A1B0BRT7_9MUSC